MAAYSPPEFITPVASIPACSEPTHAKSEDVTPPGWSIPRESAKERFVKKPLGCIVYPPYLKILNPILQRRYDPECSLRVTQWYWGYRGFQYYFLRRTVNAYQRIKGSEVLIIGCGTGRDVGSWMRYRPRRLVAVDLFNYGRAWVQLRTLHGPRLRFAQGDVTDLGAFGHEAFDIFGSDAVLEHVTNLPLVLAESQKVLKPRGVFYASFGPLWYCFGGDHVSGYDNCANGYNHLILNETEYAEYLARAGEFSHSEDDGRTWIRHVLFSRLKFRDYISMITDAGFTIERLALVIDPRAVRCLTENPQLCQRLNELAEDLDLLVAGVSVIARKSHLSQHRSISDPARRG